MDLVVGTAAFFVRSVVETQTQNSDMIWDGAGTAVGVGPIQKM